MLIFVSLSFEPASVKELVVTVSMTVKTWIFDKVATTTHL